MIKGVLYAWVRNINLPGTPQGTGSQLMYSKDRGVNWTWVDWDWPGYRGYRGRDIGDIGDSHLLKGLQ